MKGRSPACSLWASAYRFGDADKPLDARRPHFQMHHLGQRAGCSAAISQMPGGGDDKGMIAPDFSAQGSLNVIKIIAVQKARVKVHIRPTARNIHQTDAPSPLTELSIAFRFTTKRDTQLIYQRLKVGAHSDNFCALYAQKARCGTIMAI